jgi:phospholipid/cholesterol/gamma-HCH transport system substrate-binding protein
MYASRTTQLIVGIFAVIGIAALALLSFRLGRVELLPAPGYTLFAYFETVAGLKTGDQVEISGVKVGKVTRIALKDNRAQVALRIDDGVKIDDDAFAAVKSSGIIGDKFISIALGPGDRDLQDRGVIRHTQSSFVLEDLIGQLINSGGPGSGPSKSSGGSSSNGGISTPGVGSSGSTPADNASANAGNCCKKNP